MIYKARKKKQYNFFDIKIAENHSKKETENKFNF